MILTVVEHEKILIGRDRNLSKKQLSKKDIELLRVIDINNKGIFKWGHKYISPQQWVGVISLPGVSIEILPKVAGEHEKSELKEILLHMFNIGNDIPKKNNVNAKVDFSKNGLVEILISNYIGKIERYIREGFITKYRKVVKNIPCIKGGIVFSKHINKNILNPTRFFCEYSRLEVDNDINRLFKFTLMQMRQISKEHSNINKINTVLKFFYGVSIVDCRKIDCINIQKNAINSRVNSIIYYSNMFLEGYSVSLNAGNKSVTSMLFDMNKIFEMFIYKSYKKIYRENVFYQDNKHHLLTGINTLDKKIRLKPDLMIKSLNGYNMVVDTKWKDFKRFPKESDVYQMNAYLSCISGIDVAVLIYPKTIHNNDIIDDYIIENNLNDKILKIRTVDLSLLLDNHLFEKHLISLII